MNQKIVLVCWAALVCALAGCSDTPHQQRQESPAVRIVTLEPQPGTMSVTLTGAIAARVETNASFRTSGRIVERSVDVGNRVQAGQVLARIDNKVQKADVESARAALSAAEAQVKQASTAFARIEKLLRDGYTTRREYDAAEAALKVARATAQSARARLASAEETLSFTDLKADADGIVTARQADVGETVQPATPVFTIAQDGPRDAVFDLYESLLLRGDEPATVIVALLSDPAVTTEGKVRQRTPNVDPRTGTVRVKVELDNVPEQMTLGAAVTGTGTLPTRPAFTLPAAAMTSHAGQTAVWVLNPGPKTVAPRLVHVASYDASSAVIDDGLQAGDQVVVDGVKLLRPGQGVTVVAEGVGR